MRKIFLLFAFACLQLFAHAQNLIAVEHSGVSSFYTTFDSAYAAAQNGDNVYLPGGSFTVGNSISKSLHIYGAGYNQDSSTTTGITVLNNISLLPGADNGSIEGIYFNGPNINNIGSITFGDGNNVTKIAGYTISYCYLQTGIKFLNPSSSILIRNNYMLGFGDGSIYSYSISGFLSNSLISNNVISSAITIVNDNNNVIFSNNIFSWGSSVYYLILGSNCTYQNNIFQHGNTSSVQNSFFYNNLNASPYGNGNFNIGLIYETWDLIFTNPGPGPYYGYDVHYNYHLKSTSLGHNAGTDGTDIGIYGGTFPWKDGSMPANPHIISKTISGITDANGNLNVNIKVAAQKN